ncbi:MAG TPA: DEAD/DEAH box helicase, partial [Oscillospiraceae bacterium]|nr:DEAD/DEAH box helicase [Oscillospiraceae bacterium]
HLVTDSPEVAQRITEIASDSEAALDICELEMTAAQDVLEEREEALAKKLESMRRRKRRLVDPLQFEFSIMEEDLAGYQPAFGWEMQPPSDSQCETLEKFGVNPEGVESAGKASLMIDKLIKRASSGLATPKQIRQLEQRGFRHVGQWSKDQAAKLISQIAANSWRTPYHIDPSTYKPEVH